MEAGKSFEHFIFLELIAYKNLCEKRDEISYWRTKEGYEVDFIVQNQAIEIKFANLIDKRHLKGLVEFHNDHDNFKLNLVCLEPRKRILTLAQKEITIWPVQDFLDALWGNEIWSQT